MKKILIVIVILIVIAILAVGAMWVFKICPPAGPWPMPPWCENSDAPNLPSISGILFSKLPPEDEWQQPQEHIDMISGSDWRIPEDRMKIETGHTLMDFYSTIMFKNRYKSTILSMKDNGAQWVVFDNYNSYHQLNPPVIGSFPYSGNYSFRDATSEEIGDMIKTAHSNGMKFALMTELNYDVAMDKYYETITGEDSIWKNSSVAEGWRKVNEFGDVSRGLLNEMAEGLENPSDEQTVFWNQWFVEYEKFLLSQAEAADMYQADMLVIGKQLDSAINLGNTERWNSLIEKVRGVYSGPISYAALTYNDYTQLQDCGFIESLDYITIFMYNAVSEEENPSIADLKASFETIIDEQADHYYKMYGKKVILLTPFQSRDFGAKQVWFEPGFVTENETQDLLIQAKLYEALFQALEDEESVEMVWTWGYWWLENDFNREDGTPAAYEKSSTVRNKPAAEVIKRWSLIP